MTSTLESEKGGGKGSYKCEGPYTFPLTSATIPLFFGAKFDVLFFWSPRSHALYGPAVYALLMIWAFVMPSVI